MTVQLNSWGTVYLSVNYQGSYSLAGAFTTLFICQIALTMDAMKAERVGLNDIEMYYGTEGAGEPLLLLHGDTGCPEDWVRWIILRSVSAGRLD